MHCWCRNTGTKRVKSRMNEECYKLFISLFHGSITVAVYFTRLVWLLTGFAFYQPASSKPLVWTPEVESSRMSLASRTFSSPWPRRSSPWPGPRSLKSSKIALSSARGQHYFLYPRNLVEKRQKPCGKLAKTFLVFHNWRSPEKVYYYYYW